MKRMLFPIIGIVVAGAFLSGVMAKVDAGESHECTLASLEGSYGYTSTGTLVDIGPVGNVGLFTFDGQGNLTQQLTNSRNGVITRAEWTGTYTVSSNCRGSWEITSGTTADIVINADGNEVMFIRTNDGATITGILRKQFSQQKDN